MIRVSMSKKSIIIDTDPSPDDAAAILVALGSPKEIEILALTTVGGNVSVEQTTINTLKTLEIVNRGDVPVYVGAKKPMEIELITAEHVHGGDGFEGYDLPEPTITAAKGFAPDKIVELIMNNPPKTITICAIAPLTNIALALEKEPRIAERIEEIVIMGGARSEGGNVTPAAEYNIYVDPKAAKIVIDCGAPITMFPLDCTHQALSNDKRLNKLRAANAPHMEAFYHLLAYNKIHDEQKMGTDGGPLHDPTVIAYLLKPEIFWGKKVNVSIVIDDELTRGMTVVDWWGKMELPINVNYLTQIDVDGYFDLIIERMALAYKPV